MTFEKFKKTFFVLMREKNSRNKFYDIIPSSIQAAFFDNEIVDSYEHTMSHLIHLIFGCAIASDVEYFLYEWKPGYRLLSEKKEYVIHTEEDILEYIRNEYFDTDDNITTKENK